MARGEFRNFTNVNGRTVEGELLLVENGAAVVKLRNETTAKISLDALSAEDRNFINAWQEENKKKVGPMDIRLTIDKDTDRVERTVVRPKGGGGAKGQQGNQITKKHTIDDFNYTCTLKNFSQKDIAGIKAEYIIYKRSIGRDKGGLKNETTKTRGEKEISLLEASGTTTFDTEKVRCEDTSESGTGGGKGGGKTQTTWKRESILGIVVTVSVDGNELLKQSAPEALLTRLREAELRGESLD